MSVRLRLGIWTTVAAAAACLICSAAQADDVGNDEIITRWKSSVLRMEHFTKYTDGEDMTWLMSPYLRGLALMAEATGDRECMDMFSRAFEHVMSLAGEDIDGLFGWPTIKGNYGKHGKRCIIMDDAIICEPVAIFGRVLKKNPKLNNIYGGRYRKYLSFVENKIFPKWKDSWLELKTETVTLVYEGPTRRRGRVKLPEPAGVYRFYMPGKKPAMSLPLNQFWHVARCYLALYDATGTAEYLDKATMMARTGKYIYLEKSDDRVRPWCYWKPVCPGDFKSENEPVAWSGPHPKRSSYACFEVAQMAEFHRRKIVFTDDDVKRIVKLHLDYQWNKDLENPKFEYHYERRPRYKKPSPVALWTSLARFDPTIARMSARYKTREHILSIAHRWRGIVGVPKWLMKNKK